MVGNSANQFVHMKLVFVYVSRISTSRYIAVETYDVWVEYVVLNDIEYEFFENMKRTQNTCTTVTSSTVNTNSTLRWGKQHHLLPPNTIWPSQMQITADRIQNGKKREKKQKEWNKA